MNEYLILLIYFLSAYLLSFIVYYILLKRTKKRETILEIEYLSRKFKIPKNKLNNKKIKWMFNIVNPLIISITFMVVIEIHSFTFGLLVGFAVMMALVYSIYEIIGKIIKRRIDKDV